MAIRFIGYNVVAPTRLFLKALRRTAIELANICDVVTLYVLRVPVVLCNVSILVAIIPRILGIVIESKHSIVMLLV